MTKYIFITGGVVSSLGKGILAASLGKLLRARGFSVANQKLDPYLNVNPGNMSPFQHGEVFITDDGGEADLDLGHYERFTDTALSKINSFPAGEIYSNVIKRERRGEYNGGTVQVIPHITNEIKAGILRAAKQVNPDFLITEIGGTVGDIESLPHMEAIRQFCVEEGRGKSVCVHMTLLPYMSTSAELKTKPSQHSVTTLRGLGIQPEILVCRTQKPIAKEERDKLALFCSVTKDCVIECLDMSTIYEVPLALEKQGLANVILQKLGMPDKTPDLDSWIKMVDSAKNPKQTLKAAIVGECSGLNDAYLSVVESLKHAGYKHGAKIDIKWIESEKCTDDEKVKDAVGKVDIIVVPGVYGAKGIEGKLNIIKYARENDVPYLGISLGLQCAVIEFARNVADLGSANSTEFSNSTPFPVINLMEKEKTNAGYSSSTRVGSFECSLKNKTKAKSIYGANTIHERHRHRYEVNNEFLSTLEEKGLVISGTTPDGLLVEMIEIPSNKFYVACQFHPEFKSRPERPHPLFDALVSAAVK